jgi:putative ABC transport system permease protein
MWKYLPLTAKNLLRNRRRTILTVMSITVSLFLLGFLLTVYAAFYHRNEPEIRARRLITRHRVSLGQLMPEYYGDRIRAVEGVEAVSILNWFGGTYIDNRPEHMFPRFAVEADKVFLLMQEYKVPRDQLEAFLRDQQAIAVGRWVADKVGLKLGQRITIKGDVYPINPEFTVRAIFEGPDDNQAFFHWKYMQESLPKEWRGSAGIFSILVKTPRDVPRVAKAVDEMFRNAPEPTKTETEAAFNLAFVNQIGNIKLFLISIAGAIVFTIMLVSANTMAMTVRERIREIGVLKTLGFTTSTVLLMILLESLAVALTGGVLGVVLCYFATQALGDMMIVFLTGLTMPLWGIPICLGAALLIGLLSSLVPASMAARTTITDALRHAG